MPLEPNDIELLTAYARDRNERAFARLVERHGRWIAAAARRRLGDDHLADDATQAVFLVLAEKASALVASTRGSLSPWLFHVMHFTSARLRRSRLRQLAREASAEPARPREDEPVVALLEECVAELPAADREVVVRRFYRGETFAEIGAALGTTADAARKRVGRALAEVRRRMADDAFVMLKKPRRAAAPSRAESERIERITKEIMATPIQGTSPAGGHQMVSAEFVVADVEANLAFFEALGFPRRFVDAPDADGRIPRASLTAGRLGKVWIRRPVGDERVRPSPGVTPFFWIEGGPDALVAFRGRVADAGVPTTPIVDEHRLPNFTVTTPDGHAIAFFTAYVAPGTPPVVFET